MPEDDDAVRERIAQLQEENSQLREAARTFGELAERLNAELREERRRNADRRTRPRDTRDRRLPHMAER